MKRGGGTLNRGGGGTEEEGEDVAGRRNSKGHFVNDVSSFKQHCFRIHHCARLTRTKTHPKLWQARQPSVINIHAETNP